MKMIEFPKNLLISSFFFYISNLSKSALDVTEAGVGVAPLGLAGLLGGGLGYFLFGWGEYEEPSRTRAPMPLSRSWSSRGYRWVGRTRWLSLLCLRRFYLS